MSESVWGDDADERALPSIPAPRQPRRASGMDSAITVAREMLAEYGNAAGYDIWAYARAHGALAESLRILLRAVEREGQ